MEEWRDIPGYEGLYQVSNQGRVKSLEKIVDRKRMGCYIKKEFIMKPTKHKGYKNVILSKNGISKRYKVHRLVAMCFLDDYSKDLQVNHIDENKLNNNISNLEMCSNKYNCRYGSRRTKLAKPVIQETLEGKFVKEWISIREITRTLGYARACI